MLICRFRFHLFYVRSHLSACICAAAGSVSICFMQNHTSAYSSAQQQIPSAQCRTTYVCICAAADLVYALGRTTTVCMCVWAAADPVSSSRTPLQSNPTHPSRVPAEPPNPLQISVTRFPVDLQPHGDPDLWLIRLLDLKTQRSTAKQNQNTLERP